MQLAATRKGGRKRCSGGSGLLKYNPVSAVRAEAPPCGGTKNSLRGLRHENICATFIKTRRLRITKTQNEKNRRKTTANEQRFSFNPPAPLRRQRTAESTQTTLTRAVAPVTPGVKLPGAKIKQKLFTRKSPPEQLEEGRDRGVTRPEIKASGLEMAAQRMT